MDMACHLDQRHPRGRALGLEEGLRGSDPRGEGRLLCHGKFPPPCDMTTGCKGETRAVADQDDMGVAFHDCAGSGIAQCAWRVFCTYTDTRSAGHVFFTTAFTHTSDARSGRQSWLSQMSASPNARHPSNSAAKLPGVMSVKRRPSFTRSPVPRLNDR